MADQGDLPRALKLAVSQIQPGSGPLEPMTEQDRAWLNEVLGEMAASRSSEDSSGTTGGSGVCLRTGSSGISSVLFGLAELVARENKPHMIDAVKNELQHIADDGELVDTADDSDRRNAVAPISALLCVCRPRAANTAAPLRSMLAPLCSILAEVAQNSPECQEEAMRLIPQLIDIVKNSHADPHTMTKAIYALSAIVRGNPSPSVANYLIVKPEENLDNATAAAAVTSTEKSAAPGGPAEEENTTKPEQQPNEGLVDILVDVVLLGQQPAGAAGAADAGNGPPLPVNDNEDVRTPPAAARLKAAFLVSCLAEQRHDVRQHLSQKYQRHFDNRLQSEADDNVRELIDTTLKRIHTNKVTEDGQPPLALL